MHTVWRIQNKEGRGPYTSGASGWQCRPHSPQNGCPGPYDDAGLAAFWSKVEGWREYRFGFASLEMLSEWFTPIEIRNLKVQGFEIVELQASEVHFGTHQVLYKVLEEKSNQDDLVDAEYYDEFKITAV